MALNICSHKHSLKWHIFVTILDIMKIKIFTWLCISMAFVVVSWAVPLKQEFDRAAFYAALKSDDVSKINSELSVIDGASFTEKEAYKGTLLMKKAGLVKRPKEKLALFKEGRIKLETEVHNNPDNTEYRFLRLIIQEHAPKITKYRAQLDEDSEYIKRNYKNLSPVVQQVVLDYSKTSRILHSSDF